MLNRYSVTSEGFCYWINDDLLFEGVIAQFDNKELAEEYCDFLNVKANVKVAQETYYPRDYSKINISRCVKLIYACMEELVEALREIPSRKCWASKSAANKPVNTNAFIEELVDAQLFLYAVLHWAGIDLNRFIANALAKQIKNKQRKDHAN